MYTVLLNTVYVHCTLALLVCMSTYSIYRLHEFAAPAALPPVQICIMPPFSGQHSPDGPAVWTRSGSLLGIEETLEIEVIATAYQKHGKRSQMPLRFGSFANSNFEVLFGPHDGATATLRNTTTGATEPLVRMHKNPPSNMSSSRWQW